LKITLPNSTVFDKFRHENPRKNTFLPKKAEFAAFFLEFVLHRETFGADFRVFSKIRSMQVLRSDFDQCF